MSSTKRFYIEAIMFYFDARKDWAKEYYRRAMKEKNFEKLQKIKDFYLWALDKDLEVMERRTGRLVFKKFKEEVEKNGNS